MTDNLLSPLSSFLPPRLFPLPLPMAVTSRSQAPRPRHLPAPRRRAPRPPRRQGSLHPRGDAHGGGGVAAAGLPAAIERRVYPYRLQGVDVPAG